MCTVGRSHIQDTISWSVWSVEEIQNSVWLCGMFNFYREVRDVQLCFPQISPNFFDLFAQLPFD